MSKISAKQLSILSQAFHRFGHDLIPRGTKFIQLAFKLKPKSYTKTAILGFLMDQLGLKENHISLSDSKYYVEEWEKWEQIIEYDLTDLKEYLHDVRDCDNFAFAFASNAGIIYGLNTCGVAYGTIYSKKTGKRLGRHAFNLILIHKDGVLKLYLYEPMNDQYKVWEKGKDNALGGTTPWIYKPDWCFFF